MNGSKDFVKERKKDEKETFLDGKETEIGCVDV